MRTVVSEVRVVEVSPLHDDQAKVERVACDAIFRVGQRSDPPIWAG